MQRILMRLPFTFLIVGGFLIYESRTRVDANKWLMIGGGCVLLLLGGYALSLRHRKPDDPPGGA